MHLMSFRDASILSENWETPLCAWRLCLFLFVAPCFVFFRWCIAMIKQFPLIIPAAVALVFVFLPVLQAGDFNVNEKACGEYCEASDQCAVIDTLNPPLQPINTWTNLAFLVAGLMVFRRRKDRVGKLFLAATIVLTVGSGMFHAFMTRGGQLADEIGMYAVFSFLAVYATFVTFKLDLKNVWPITIASGVVGLLLAFFVTELASTSVLAILSLVIIGALIVGALNKRTSWKAIGMALLPFAVAFLFRQLDIMRVICDPQSWFQGHGVWHVLAAVGVYMIFQQIEKIDGELVEA